MVNLLKNRVFWLALITLVALVLGVFVPGYTLNAENAAGMAVITAIYLVGYAINPSGDGLSALLLSRKFWAATLGFLVLFLDGFHIFPNPLDVTAIVGWVVLISAYILMVAKDPGNGWRGLLVSRKFWVALVGLSLNIMAAFNIQLPQGITEDTVLSISVLLGGVIGAIGLQGPPAPLPDPVINEDDVPL